MRYKYIFKEDQYKNNSSLITLEDGHIKVVDIKKCSFFKHLKQLRENESTNTYSTEDQYKNSLSLIT